MGNMMEPEISIIVPVYNVQAYLERCVASILKQTFSNFELILVDDGSTDNSGTICDRLANEDSRIMTIHKMNGGLSDARNVGIEHARGKYIGFVDSDDYIEPVMYQFLYENIIAYNTDMSCCGVYNQYLESKTPQYKDNINILCNNIEAFGYQLEGKILPGTICNKLIKTKLISKLRFPIGKVYEDAFFTIDLMQSIKTVFISTKPLYNYMHRKSSITTTPYRKRDLDVIQAYENTLNVVSEKFPEIIKQALFRLYWSYFIVLDRMLLTKDYKKVEDYKRIVRYLKKNLSNILNSPYFTRSRKLSAIALKINVNLYRMILFYQEARTRRLLE